MELKKRSFKDNIQYIFNKAKNKEITLEMLYAHIESLLDIWDDEIGMMLLDRLDDTEKIIAIDHLPVSEEDKQYLESGDVVRLVLYKPKDIANNEIGNILKEALDKISRLYAR